MYLSYSTALTADFIAIYTPGFSDMIRRSCDSTLITWSMASQYTPTVAKIKTGESSAVGSETVSWTVRETFGWQGKLNGKRHKCNEARIPTNAFYLKRKAFIAWKAATCCSMIISNYWMRLSRIWRILQIEKCVTVSEVDNNLRDLQNSSYFISYESRSIIVLLFLQNNSKFKNKLKSANLGRCKFISVMHLYREV